MGTDFFSAWRPKQHPYPVESFKPFHLFRDFCKRNTTAYSPFFLFGSTFISAALKTDFPPCTNIMPPELKSGVSLFWIKKIKTKAVLNVLLCWPIKALQQTLPLITDAGLRWSSNIIQETVYIAALFTGFKSSRAASWQTERCLCASWLR